MKLNINSFLSSIPISKKSKKNKNNSNPSSNNSSFHSTTSSDSFSSHQASTPKSILPPLPVRHLFTVFDTDRDGKITKQELEKVLSRLSPLPPPTPDEVASMVAEVDIDGDGCISLEEFGALGAVALEGAEDRDELREAFSVFDADGDGKISAEELHGVFLALGDVGCTVEECRKMIGGVDSDGDGFVGFEDFARMMEGQKLW